MTPWEAHTGAGLLAGLVTRRKPTLDHSVPEGLDPVEIACAGAEEKCEEKEAADNLW